MIKNLPLYSDKEYLNLTLPHFDQYRINNYFWVFYICVDEYSMNQKLIYNKFFNTNKLEIHMTICSDSKSNSKKYYL